LPKSDKLLYFNDKNVKLVGREAGRFDLEKFMDIKRPIHKIDDNLILKMRSSDLIFVVNNLSWTKIFGTSFITDNSLPHAQKI